MSRAHLCLRDAVADPFWECVGLFSLYKALSIVCNVIDLRGWWLQGECGEAAGVLKWLTQG